MSDNNNAVLIGAAVLGFLYMQRQSQARGVMARPGGVASMPGSTGTGLQQVATGAVAGFFQQLAKSPANNTSGTLGRMASDWDPVPRGNIAQEAVPPDYGYQPDYGYGYGADGGGLY